MHARVVQLPERAVAVVVHHGPADSVDTTRRPLYQHMIQFELIGGPSILRWLDPPIGDRVVDALVQTHMGYEGDHVVKMEHLHGGPHAVLHYEGPASGLSHGRRDLLRWVKDHGHHAAGPVLQVHLMDELDGVMEAEFQVLLRD